MVPRGAKGMIFIPSSAGEGPGVRVCSPRPPGEGQGEGCGEACPNSCLNFSEELVIAHIFGVPPLEK